MARKREYWFEYSWLGHMPCSWEGFVVLVGGVGGVVGFFSLGAWLSARMPNSDLAAIPFALAFVVALVVIVLVATHTRSKGERLAEEVNHTARRLFRTPR